MPTTVVLIHGLARTPVSLWRMEHFLSEAGFATKTVWYNSRNGGLADIAARLEEDMPKEGRVHMVGHSLGGLLALRLMAGLPPERRGRVVQLGSPNLGSPLAKIAEPLGPLLGPILKDLEDGPQEISNLDVAAIAGTAGPTGLGEYSGIHGPNDGVVTVKSAIAASPRGNHATLPVLHSFMMMDKRVIDQTLTFLHAAETAR